ncbi:MAG TPA: 4Fe-4S binding protein [Thermohalobaculum sp.]|nr:4Fe-4S binding protein [Thermohalobaculum sp.]
MAETRLMLCDCLGTHAPDAAAIGKGTGLACDKVHRHLCRDEAHAAAAALRSGDEVVIACGQEAPLFRELADEIGAGDRLTCIDIRDRGGWTEDPRPGPKMAALIAEARLDAPPVPLMEVASEGVCLILGRGQQAVDAGSRLAGALAATVMLVEPDEVVLPREVELDVVAGRVTNARGALGQFELRVDAFAEMEPGGRGHHGFGAPRDGARTSCDVIVDLTGDMALFPAHEKRDGYLRADPGDPLAVERLLFEAAQHVGTFEKALFIRFTESLCAHSRAQQPGCTRCLEVCPTAAIAPAGDTVAIDPHVCAGCGACAAVCPTGAAATDDPPVEFLFRRMRTLAEAYARAGGGAPRLLVHDLEHGAEMIRLSARFGRGLPEDAIPLGVPSLAAFGHAEMLAALALGFSGVDILAGPKTDRATIEWQMGLARAITAGVGAAGERLRLIEPADPDALSDMLYGTGAEPLGIEPILPLGGRRDTTRLAARALAGGALPDAPLDLPDGAPYGAVLVDTEACTLCLACVGLCPTGALLDNPDRPELSFREEACVQCGICANTCPEDAITLRPQLDLSDAVFQGRVLNEEEPFACVECGKLFGVKSTIENITAKLQGKHSMFTNSDNARLIQMCDDCRVRAQFHSADAPFSSAPRPRVRTTDDYIKDRSN